MVIRFEHFDIDRAAVVAVADTHRAEGPEALRTMFPGETPAAVLAATWRALIAAGAILGPEGVVREVTVTEQGPDTVAVTVAGGQTTEYRANVPAQAALLEVAAERLASLIAANPDAGIEEPIRHHT